MKKRALALILCTLTAVSLFGACAKKDNQEEIIELPIAEKNENISDATGKFFEAQGQLKATGGLSVLGKDFMKIMIEGKEVEFKLNDEVIRKIGIFNKDENDLKIKKATLLTLTYEIKDETYVATDIEIVTAN